MRKTKKKKSFYKKYQNNLSFGPVFSVFILGFVVLGLILFYLSQSNKLTMKGYEISELEQTKKELMEKKQRLEVEAARLKSIQNIQDEVSKTDMVPSDDIKFVSTSSDIALK